MKVLIGLAFAIAGITGGSSFSGVASWMQPVLCSLGIILIFEGIAFKKSTKKEVK